MKSLLSLFIGVALATSASFQASAAPAANIPFAVVERGPHHRVWARTVWETNRLGWIVARTNSYTECETSMHYFADGEWKESRAEIEAFPGGAVARFGPHKAIFANNANSPSVVDLVTARGERLRSRVVGLAYFDSSNNRAVLLATIQDAPGQLVPPNRVLYTNAFRGVLADLEYVYRKGGCEQNVIFRATPPPPADFRLNAATTRLQVITEFVDPPALTRAPTPMITPDELPDETIQLQEMSIGRGRAFAVGESADAAGAVKVAKQWVLLDGRTFLVEQVPYAKIRDQLNNLGTAPRGASLRPRRSGSGEHVIAALRGALPKPTRPQPSDRQLMAKLDAAPATGFVLDYDLVTSQSGFTFESGRTYYVNGTVNLSGTTTIRSNVVVKFAASTSARLNLTGPVSCETDSFHPAVFTAKDDNTIGETITGSTGTPTGYYGYMVAPSAGTALHDCRFSYANRAILISGNLSLTNLQFVRCSRPIYLQGSDLAITVDNALFYTNAIVFDQGHGGIFRGQHLTVHQSGPFFTGSGSPDASIYLTNSLVIGLSGWGKNINDLQTAQVPWLADGAGVFQSVGMGTHYLAASSPYRDAGTTDLTPQLWAALQQMTTFPPPESTVDSAAPDLGYHYPVLMDFDLDLIEDGWEWKHFGTVTNTGTDDYDQDGASNAAEFAAHTDPNTIKFRTYFPNNQVNAVSQTGTIELLGGVPSQLAVLVDPVNFGSPGWQAYASNFTATLGPDDGPQEVWVGLRGRAEDSEQTWMRGRVVLDREPPVLVLTNPITTAGSWTLRQFQGFSPEPLRALSLSVTNGDRHWPAVTGLVKAQHYDPQLHGFTTNYFQFFDVDLGLGVNELTIRATDLAGNTAELTQEFSVEADTTPPVLSLVWPQNQMKLWGASFTVEGFVDDPSATLSATVTAASQQAVTVVGTTERYGRFWVEDLPLADGANEVTITATDTWANTATLQFVVHRSTLALTLTPLTGDMLHQARVGVSGTVGDPTSKVWVNGVAAAVADGNWHAQDVSVREGATAAFAVTAYPANENPVADPLNPSANPFSANATSLRDCEEKPVRFWLNTDEQTLTWTNHGWWWVSSESWEDSTTKSRYHHLWQDGTNSYGDYWQYWVFRGGDYLCNMAFSWPTSYWPFVERGRRIGADDCTGYDDPYDIRIGSEHCDIHEQRGVEYPNAGLEDNYRRIAQSEWKLFTGGRPRPRVEHLFLAQAFASEILNPEAVPTDQGYLTLSHYYQRQIPSDEITLGEFGKLRPDGFRYKVLPDGETIDFTARVDGVPFYYFSAAAGKDKLADLDVDSDNINGLERSDREDEIEEQTPGKYLRVNDGDADNDGIPDFADGFNPYGTPDQPGQSAAFTPMVLEFPTMLNGDKTRFRFHYFASDPDAVQKTNDAAGNDVYTPAPGLRIWTKDGGQYRKKEQVDHYITIEDQRVQDGDFIADNTVYWATNIMHGTMTTTLFVEGITPGQYDIRVEVDPEALNEWSLHDRVTVTVGKNLDLDIDSDNNNGTDPPDRSAVEDQVEDDATKVGKVLWVNNDDSDRDDVPDFADFSSPGPDAFVPIVIEIPEEVDPSVARLQISYSASDPATVTSSGTPPVWQAGPGHLRIWRKNGDEARNATSDWVAPGTYTASELGFSGAKRVITNYVEAVAPSATKADQRILVELDPDGDGPEGFTQFDAVRATALEMPVVSRDRFLAGSIELPSGMDALELDFRNVTSGESLGRYGSLLGGGTTKIYDSVQDIMSEADIAAGGQPAGQAVWFVKDSSNPRRIAFYTCFNAVGQVHVELLLGGAHIAVREHTLAAAQDFAFWINYVDAWVKGVGFDFGELPPPPPTLLGSGLPEVPSSGPLDNLTRACLIPIFNVVAAVEGMEAVALGVFEGIKNGLLDDWHFVQAITGGTVSAGNWAWNQVYSELQQWHGDPLKRAFELKRAVDRVVIDGILTPLQNVSYDLSTWDGIKKRTWATWDAIRGGWAKAWAIDRSMKQHLADGLVSWFDDFNGRMLQGGERVAFQNTPWNEDPLLADLEEYGRQSAYTFGYVFGYLGEQATIGLVTGGVGKILVKGGISLAGNLSAKVLFQAAARSHLLKKQLASLALSVELRLAVERGLVQAAKTPISETILDSAGVVIENHLSKTVLDRSVFNLKTLVEAAVAMPNTRRLLEQNGTEWLLFHRFAVFMRMAGDAADHTMLNNFLRVFEERLVVREATGAYVEWTEDFLRSLDGIIVRFETRPPLVPLDANQLARLNELLRPGGSIWTSPPIGPTTRGVIAEVHLASTEYRGWQWSPTGEAVDFFKDSVAAQLKTTTSTTATSDLKAAVDNLINTGTTQGANQFIFDVRIAPGADSAALKSGLEQYVRDNFGNIADDVLIKVTEYEFVPN